jgi:hypothetical protein
MPKNPLSPKWRERVTSFVLVGAIAVPLIVCLSGFFIFFGQVLGWLKTGYWVHHPLSEFVGYQRADWWAVQKVVDLVLDLPASVCLAAGGFLGMIIAAIVVGFPLSKLGFFEK